MDLIKLYCYAGVPLLTCNMLFYSITALSTSITSSQNVVKFISEHKDCDSVIFKNELESLDIENKLKIVESLIYDILKRYCKSKDEFEEFKNNINAPIVICNKQDDSNQFEMIELTNRTNILDRIDEPIRYAILSMSEIVQNINELIIEIHEKIVKHKQSYLNKIISLCLKIELNEFKKKVKLFDIRLALLLDLLHLWTFKTPILAN
jgi:hypothetical protein